MTEFKTFLKIFKSQTTTMLVYIGVFFVIMGISTSSSKSESGYVNEDIRVAIVDEDNSQVSKSLKEFIKNNMKVVDIINTNEGMEEALFQRAAEYIVIIPKGFEENLLCGGNTDLKSKEVADAYSAVFAKNLINQYMSTLHTYLTLENNQLSRALSRTKENLAMSTKVEFEGKKTSSYGGIRYAFNFGAYVILASVIWGISEILSIYFKKNVADRIKVSPINVTKMNIRLVMYSLFFLGATWCIYEFLYIIILGKNMFNIQGLLMSGNLLIVGLVALALGYTVSCLVKTKNGRNGAANTIALGCSFLGGAFVPLEILGKDVLKISVFTPTYWYVSANQKIEEMVNCSASEIKSVLLYITIELLFAVAILSIGLVARNRD